MKWEDVEKQYKELLDCTDRQKTDIECPKCGKKIFKRTDIILTTNPPKYMYECECGWFGYAHI